MLRRLLRQLELFLPSTRESAPPPPPPRSPPPRSVPPSVAPSVAPNPTRTEPAPDQVPEAIPAPLWEFQFHRNPRARRYILRVHPPNRVRITIPRGGSEAFARRFAGEKSEWIRERLAQLATQAHHPTPWAAGTEVWWRGDKLRLEDGAPGRGRLGTLEFPVPPPPRDWRPSVEAGLRAVAARELPGLVAVLAARHGVPVQRVSVRNQRSRWGSCSRRGTVSLNWRLVQTPDLVRDYIIAHELAHFRQMNHSARFWLVVEEFFPAWREAERWLKRHGRELLG